MGYLEEMQSELKSEGHRVPIHVLGVNAIGSEAGNGAFTIDLELPWLQDTQAEMVWASWKAEHFNLIALDERNVEARVFDLSMNDLADPKNFEMVKQALASLADQ